MNVAAIAIACILVTALVKVIEPSSREIGFMLSAAAVVIILLSLTEDISEIISNLLGIVDRTGISSNTVMLAVKVLGISYLCEFCSNSCRDAGESALGSVVELSGKISIVVVCLPIVTALVETVVKILES